MKKSSKVFLVALGVASLAACDQEHDVKLPSYADKAACEADWGQNSSDCKPKASGGGYFGPHYYWNHAAGHPVIVNPVNGATSNAVSAPMTARGFSGSASAHPSSGFSVGRGGFGVSAHGSAGG